NEDVSTPPAWLDMLTQQERQQMSSAIPPVPFPVENEIPSSRKLPQEMAARQDFASAPLSDNEDDVRFGPEWLKSLGAAAYGDQEAQTAENIQKDVSPEEVTQWSPGAREQNVVATLEQLEQNLLSQGFVSHEPNSLSSLSHTMETETSQPSDAVEQPTSPYNKTDLFSSPAGFENVQMQIEPASSTNEATEIPSQASSSAEEPEWLTPLRASSQGSQGVEMSEWNHSPHESPVSEHFEAAQQPWTTQDLATPSPAETSVFEQTAHQVANDNSLTAQAATPPRPDPLLEGELETTMRRPAVRLQHLQSRVMAHREAARRGKQTEGASTASSEGGTTSYQDRLLRGYQYQLAGNYEEAMQEYRVIIKGAPELLGEVISNVRALLRLAPKYSAGYRVLGDAYMRQGEYLQAMESYNKALTMAKKARS
ncbi:MAG TPA: tetratricopeptide repeat protein, partial [Ktedonobacteraceae bacterium]